MSHKTLLQESNSIRKEAAKVLELTNIEDHLAKLGEVSLIGSYKYNVMVARDIDFHVVIKSFNTDLVKDFFDYAIDSSLFEYVSFHDKHTFNKEAAGRYPAKVA